LTASNASSRRHDLDALRGLTMLLGIAAHAALAYGDIPWSVQDSSRHPAYGIFYLASRGFRMQLFFLLSGYFTAMLWKRRGLPCLISHRARRILLPLSLSCLTVLPLLVLTLDFADKSGTTGAGGAEGSGTDIWSAAAVGNLEALKRQLDAGAELDREEHASGMTPLAWAIIGDRPGATRFLIEAGADPNARFRNGNSALHIAAFFGRDECAALLLSAGADARAKNVRGRTPADELEHGRPMTEHIASLADTSIDFRKVVTGRERIATLLEAEGVPPINLKLAPTGSGDDRSFLRRARDLSRFPFFYHLWFLWFLCFLVAGFALVVLLRLPAPPRFLVCSGARWLWIIPLTMLAQAAMRVGGTQPGFGPDLSTGLVPIPHVLLYDAIFFGFGALYYGAGDVDGMSVRNWWAHLPLAIFVVLPLGLAFSLHSDWTQELVGETAERWIANLLEVLYAWLMIFGLLGLFRRFLSGDRPRLRYLSDASYWLYLIHLPLIIVAQVLVSDWPLPAFVKFTLVLGVVTGLSLVAYRYGVRYTIIGRLLNGPRERPGNGEPALGGTGYGAD